MMKSVVLALALAPAAAFSPVQAPQAAAKSAEAASFLRCKGPPARSLGSRVSRLRISVGRGIKRESLAPDASDSMGRGIERESL
ncbi:hypothetical protein M885DRAFT_512754 [Pelagophyceae sp. CCMP2097]|nr:hypothetical protein M885DRAFT_512754 [Pelagophyceae sp. CCMP2097]